MKKFTLLCLLFVVLCSNYSFAMEGDVASPAPITFEQSLDWLNNKNNVIALFIRYKIENRSHTYVKIDFGRGGKERYQSYSYNIESLLNKKNEDGDYIEYGDPNHNFNRFPLRSFDRKGFYIKFLQKQIALDKYKFHTMLSVVVFFDQHFEHFKAVFLENRAFDSKYFDQCLDGRLKLKKINRQKVIFWKKREEYVLCGGRDGDREIGRYPCTKLERTATTSSSILPGKYITRQLSLGDLVRENELNLAFDLSELEGYNG